MGDGEFVLHDDLGALLGGVKPAALSRAVSEQAAQFADMIAQHMGLGRVLSTGSFFAELVAKHAPDLELVDPAASSRGRLTFQVLEVPSLYSSNPTHRRVLRVTASVKGLTEPVVEEVLSCDASG